MKIPRSANNTPIRKALEEFHRPVQRDPGRPLTTWWSTIKNDLKTLDITEDDSSENLTNLTKERESWKKTIKTKMKEKK